MEMGFILLLRAIHRLDMPRARQDGQRVSSLRAEQQHKTSNVLLCVKSSMRITKPTLITSFQTKITWSQDICLCITRSIHTEQLLQVPSPLHRLITEGTKKARDMRRNCILLSHVLELNLCYWLAFSVRFPGLTNLIK